MADAAASAGATEVYKLQDHPQSERTPVLASHTAPQAGFYVATWDNRNGWRERHLYHRWDILVDGHPLVGAELAAVLDVEGAGAAEELPVPFIGAAGARDGDVATIGTGDPGASAAVEPVA
jgi:hypothetical protein